MDTQLEISKRTLSTREESLRLIKERQQGGVATMLDVRQAEQLVYTAAAAMEGILVQGDLAGMLNLQQPAGFLVQRVAEGSPGSRLGIRPGTLRASIEGSDLMLGGDGHPLGQWD